MRARDDARAGRAATRERARQAVARAAALAGNAERAIAQATYLVGRTQPLAADGPHAPHEDASRALRAFNELELAGRSASRVAVRVSSARHALGHEDVAEVAGAAATAQADLRDRDFIDAHRALRAMARTAVIASVTSASVHEAAEFCEAATHDPAVMSGAQRMDMILALRQVRPAARLTDEVSARTANAGRQLARALGWEADLPILLSEARAAAARDPDGESLLIA